MCVRVCVSLSLSPSVSRPLQTADPGGGEGAPVRGERCGGGASDRALDVRRVFQRCHELLPGQGQTLRDAECVCVCVRERESVSTQTAEINNEYKCKVEGGQSEVTDTSGQCLYKLIRSSVVLLRGLCRAVCLLNVVGRPILSLS